ncbi:40621_t:CDS:1, partial [Gigaspora margarita]
DEYLKMGNVSSNETPTEWINRIWSRLQYFKENDLLSTNSKKYLKARKLIIYWSKVNGFYKSYAPEIGIAICFSCNQLVYTGKRTKNIGNYNHIGMERHWATHCTGNSFCNVSYDEYLLRVEQKAIYGYNYNNEYALQRYGIWMQNAIKKIE